MPFKRVLTTEQRLMKFSGPPTDRGCRLWLGAVDRHGYGLMMMGSRSDGTRRLAKAHRVAFETFVGPIPPGMFVCHRCDTPGCIEASHLFAGTVVDNKLDEMVKRRHVRKLGDDEVRLVRRLSERREISDAAIARLFGIQTLQVRNIRTGHSQSIVR